VALYDVIADPTEERNVANENRDTVERMRRRLDEWWHVDDPFPLTFESRPPETIAFDFRRGPEGWSRARDIASLSLDEEGLIINARGNDPIMVISPCAIDPAAVRRVRVRLAATAGKKTELRWGTEHPGRIDPGKVVSAPLVADGEFHEVVFDVAAHAQWLGKPIIRLRFDPGDAEGAFRIAWMRAE
jgi:hypothetical protein